jgi:tyrosyl-tRNA synthetase
MVHSREEYENAVAASKILFGKSTTDELKALDEKTFLSVFEGVPVFTVSMNKLKEGVPALDLLTDEAAVFPSKGELKRLIKGGGLSLNKQKVTSMDATIDDEYLLNEKYILVQKGKKNYFVLKVE